MCDMSEMPEPQKEPDLLKMVGENPVIEPEKTEETSQKKEDGKKATFELPLDFVVAQEMQEIFDEDIVVHRQGSAEPESD